MLSFVSSFFLLSPLFFILCLPISSYLSSGTLPISLSLSFVGEEGKGGGVGMIVLCFVSVWLEVEKLKDRKSEFI